MKISYIFQLFCFLSLWNSYPGFVQWLFEISVPKHILILKLPRRIFCFVLPEDISNCQYLCSKKDFFCQLPVYAEINCKNTDEEMIAFRLCILAHVKSKKGQFF